jgi:hypothetical protein
MKFVNDTCGQPWRWIAIGALAAGIAACESTPSTPDAATDQPQPPVDMVMPPSDVGDVPAPPPPPPPPPPADAGDVPTPPPDVQMPSLRSRAIVECGEVCMRPLDAIPDARGANVFFTAFTPTGTAAVFRAAIPAEGAPAVAPTLVREGSGMEFPVGIALSADDATIYVADQSATRGDVVGIGAIFAIPAVMGSVSQVNVSEELLHPASIALSSDGANLLIAGQQRNDMGLRRALFRVPRGGGMTTVLTHDLVDPSGVSQASDGAILCHDTRRGGARAATAVLVGAAAVTEFAGGLVANYPAGLAHAMDNRSAIFSGADPSVGPGLLTFTGPDGRPMAPAELSAGMAAPLGLHRARMSDTWAVADESGMGGRIFLVTRR